MTKKTSLFDIKAHRLIGNEGLDIKQSNQPLLEIVIGQSNTCDEWLPIELTNGNEDLLNVSPYYSVDAKMIARRDYYEIISARKKYSIEPLADDTSIDFFLKVTTNGFFHLVKPLEPFKGYHYLESIFRQIFDMILYSIEMMKYQKIKSDQTFKVILKNVQGLEIKGVEDFGFPRYFFPKTDPAPFDGYFNPSGSWEEIGLSLKRLFIEVGREINFTPNDEAINERLNIILSCNLYVKYGNGHNFLGSKKHIHFDGIKISEFGFEQIGKKG